MKIKSFKKIDYKNIDVQSTSVNNKLINKINSQLHRSRQSFSTWRTALTLAENQTNPNYYYIQSVFQEISEDSAVYLNQTIRKNSILSSDFELFKNDKEDEKLEEFFEGKWFNDFLSHTLDSIFYGYSLIQISEIKNDMITLVENINRQNVNPKTKMIIESPHIQTGVNFLEDVEYSPYLLFVSPMDNNSNYLGNYNILAPWTISKRVALSSNNEFLAKFGIPNIVYKSDIQDIEYRQNIEEYLSNFSNLGYLYSSKQDEIELVEPTNSSNEVFRKTIEDCNQTIAKTILGSDMSSEKSFVGSVEAQERILTMFYESDKKFVETVVNEQLIPKLIALGLTFLQGAKFEYCEKEEDNSKLFDQTVQLLQLGYQVDNAWIMEKFGIPVNGIVKKDTTTEDV